MQQSDASELSEPISSRVKGQGGFPQLGTPGSGVLPFAIQVASGAGVTYLTHHVPPAIPYLA